MLNYFVPEFSSQFAIVSKVRPSSCTINCTAAGVKSMSLEATPQLKAKVSAHRKPSTENVGRTQATRERERPKSKDDIEREPNT